MMVDTLSLTEQPSTYWTDPQSMSARVVVAECNDWDA